MAAPCFTIPAATALRVGAYDILPALNDQLPAVDQGIRQFLARSVVNRLNGGARDADLSGAVLLRVIKQIDQADDLVLVHRHLNGVLRRAVKRSEPVAFGQCADTPALFRARHRVRHLF